MLEIFNNLQPFIEDCSRRYAVREYARIRKISPPTSSTMLSNLNKEGLLNKTRERNYILFWANKGNHIFKKLAQIYWKIKFEEAELLPYLRKTLTAPTIILFGSLAKAENTRESDIDLAVIAPKRKMFLEKYEKKLKRKINLLTINNIHEIKNNQLQSNILNGYVMEGRINNGLERMQYEETGKRDIYRRKSY